MHKFLLLFMFVMAAVAATGAATVFIFCFLGGALHDYFWFLRQLRYVLPMLAINSHLVVLNTQ